jgi:hypothetical protein
MVNNVYEKEEIVWWDVDKTAISEICKLSVSIHFVSEG